MIDLASVVPDQGVVIFHPDGLKHLYIRQREEAY